MQVKKTSKFPPRKPTNPIIKATVAKDWSEYQKAIFRNIAREDGHLLIEALAGSGKTASFVESFKYVPNNKKILALAFNKRNQEDLRARSPSYVDCYTFHSLGFRAIKQRFINVEIDEYKVQTIVNNLLGEDASFDLIKNICDTVAYCKYALTDTPRQIKSIIDNPNLNIDLCEYERDDFVSLVIQTLSANKADVTKIDFNDMCYFPFIFNMNLGTYDFVYIDERQDLNKSQIVMARKACKPVTGRIIAVGDKLQEIYGFRLSDSSMIEDMMKENNAKTLTLPISYRCPKKVIALAKFWAKEITCPDSAIEGEVNEINLNKLYDEVTPGCFVLSRVNAPLVKICMELIRRGKKANILGRDIGKNLSYLIKKSKKKQMPAFLEWLDQWLKEQVELFTRKNISVDNLYDRHECLTTVCNESKNLAEVSKKIEEMFNETSGDKIIQLSSVHKSKGMEANDVFVLKWTFRQWLDSSCDKLIGPSQEANLAYIAVTRSQKRLFIVNKI